MLRLALQGSRHDHSSDTLEVLVVDASDDHLEGLRRAFHRDRARWELTFCTDPRQAFGVLKKSRPDVVVSAGPATVEGGTDLLALAREVSPAAARIRLVDDVETESVLESTRAAHQVLLQSAGHDELRSAIERLAASRHSLPEERLRALVADVQVLPTPSDVQRRLTEVLNRQHDLADVAEVVETDVALTAELLRLVNSSFFSLATRVSTVREAVGMLGLELVEATVAARSLFSEEIDLPIDANEVNRHSQLVAGVAGNVAAGGGVSKLDRSLVVSAGLLHDVGVLLLAQLSPKGADSAADVLAIDDLDAERLAFGADRYAIGAHLLDLWAFSERTPAAIREMQRPTRELGAGTVGWSLRLAHHAVTQHGIGLPAGPDDRDWFDDVAAIERELLLG